MRGSQNNRSRHVHAQLDRRRCPDGGMRAEDILLVLPEAADGVEVVLGHHTRRAEGCLRLLQQVSLDGEFS